MQIHPLVRFFASWLLAPWLALQAQTAYTLPEAVKQALDHHPSIEAATARVQAAEARIAQARGGWLPQATYREIVQRGNNPVYVFGALLTQHQFTAANFALGSLNQPNALNNFQSQLNVEQSLYDFGATMNAVRAAGVERKLSEEERRAARMALIAAVARAYYGVALSEQALALAEEALQSAQADLERARKLSTAGLATDADVLSVQVHVSAMNEQRSRRSAELRVAKAALNDALALPLDTVLTLSTPLRAVPIETSASGTDRESTALAQRPEAIGARLGVELSAARESMARAQYLPKIGFHGSFEADRQDWAAKGGTNWMLALGAQWSLFDGGRTRAQVSEARQGSVVARAQLRQTESTARLQVRRAQANADAARERVATTETTVAEAEESLRIIRNRYTSGLANVTDLLRSETALVEAKTRRLAAIYDARTAAIDLDAAAGTLNGDSDVLK
jgi:outer membrane protein TolC